MSVPLRRSSDAGLMSKGAIREHQNQQGDAELDGLMEDISNMEQHMDNVARTPIAPSPTDIWFKGLHAPPMRQGKPVDVYATVVVKNISRVKLSLVWMIP